MTTPRTVTRLLGGDTCDACHHHATIAFRVEFADGSYSRRCARHVGPAHDHAARHKYTQPIPAGLLPAMAELA